MRFLGSAFVLRVIEFDKLGLNFTAFRHRFFFKEKVRFIFLYHNMHLWVTLFNFFLLSSEMGYIDSVLYNEYASSFA